MRSTFISLEEGYVSPSRPFPRAATRRTTALPNPTSFSPRYEDDHATATDAETGDDEGRMPAGDDAPAGGGVMPDILIMFADDFNADPLESWANHTPGLCVGTGEGGGRHQTSVTSPSPAFWPEFVRI